MLPSTRMQTYGVINMTKPHIVSENKEPCRTHKVYFDRYTLTFFHNDKDNVPTIDYCELQESNQKIAAITLSPEGIKLKTY